MYTNRTAEEVGWRVCVSGIPDAKSIKESFKKPSSRRVYLYLKPDTPVVQMDAKSVVTTPSLHDLYDTLKNRTRALEALGGIPKSHGCILLPICELKLPSAILEKWELELADTPDDEIDLELFFKFLNRQVVSKEASERNLFSEAKPLTVPSCRFCRGGHGSLNCPEFNGKAVDDRWKLVQETTENPTNTTLTGLAASKSSTTMKETLLQTALAKLSVNGQEVTVRVLLDSGSQRSYIRKNIAESIGLQGPSEVLSVATLGGETSLTLADSYPLNSVQVDVLIGADHYYSFVTGTCKRGENPESLVAVKSYFGWIITGPVDSYSKHTSAMLTMVENNEVTASLRRFWELESIGIVEAVNPTMSQEEELAVNDFNDGLNFDGKNYEVRLPWKRDHPKLENNYAQAVKRLESIERKLK
ncbi:uncharacterized protein LOC122962152 [Acropora millepora]|uniref:uncharacterized protein LOC122962152 n=1 Tax=Acropora millepora TaxID=45264 RepID=UPI001CF0FBD3|nr:uncharacterized protein LOC122962152 [Acropora millepora]